MKELNVVQMEEINGGDLLWVCGAATVIGGIGMWFIFIAPEFTLGTYALSLGASAICGM